MDFSYFSSLLILTLHIHFHFFSSGTFGAKFKFVNKCPYTVWPGILSNAGSPGLDTTGFELPEGYNRTVPAPAGWSGRFWGRTGCTFSGASSSCQTGDCGSGQPECNGSGASPPATLAEITLGHGEGGLDFYDVSLVDGFNLPMIVEASGGSSSGVCATTGCVVDLNQACPAELLARGGKACRSACDAFGKPEYCCSGAYGSPASCRPSAYSRAFKVACPRSYSYAYDDPTSTFTCSGADYVVTFCPSVPSQKSSEETTSETTTEGEINDASGSLSGFETTGINVSGSGFGSEVMLGEGSWMAGLAMGDSWASSCCSRSGLVIIGSTIVVLLILFI